MANQISFLSHTVPEFQRAWCSEAMMLRRTQPPPTPPSLSARPTAVVPEPVFSLLKLSPSMNCLSFSRISLIRRRRGDGGSRRFFRRSSFHSVRQSVSEESCAVALAVISRQGSSVEHVAGEEDKVRSDMSDERQALELYDEERRNFSKIADEGEVFDIVGAVRADVRHVPAVEVTGLEEIPELWRRSRLAWLCKELPSHNVGTLLRILRAQRKWMRQEDATYLANHCMQMRESDVSFWVYRWMTGRHWYRFDFGLASKLADYLGKRRKFENCREIFDDILNHGRVPSESTFYLLVVAYLGAPVQGCLEEASNIYNRMIQLGGYQPPLRLHNSLFRALISKPGDSKKSHLKQAEFVFHNLVTTGLEVQKDVYRGLIWLHSYQDTIDKERISFLKDEMRKAGFEEDKEVMVWLLRACAKDGDVKESERTWAKLLEFDGRVPSQAFVYRMDVYSEVGEFARSFEIFRDMERRLGSASVAGYHKIIEILCKFQQVEMAESVMREFIESGKTALTPSYIDIAKMYLELDEHDKLESAFVECTEKCRANQTIHNIYLESLVKAGNFDKAEKQFNEMHNGAIGVNSCSCNTVLKGYINSGRYAKAERIYVMMCQFKYDIEPPLMEKLEDFRRTSRKEIRKHLSLKLSKAQREIVVGMLLGGLQIESDEARKNHKLRFDFRQKLEAHSILRKHIYNQFHEWLNTQSYVGNDANGEIVPFRFSSISHSYFGFYADQFWPKGHPEIPKLIHRWLSPRSLAYWYMYGGHRTSSGDTVLKLKGSLTGVEKIVKGLRGKSLECRVKKKGNVFWIGILETNSVWFWKLIEPYVLDELTDILKPRYQTGVETETRTMDFGSGSYRSDDDG